MSAERRPRRLVAPAGRGAARLAGDVPDATVARQLSARPPRMRTLPSLSARWRRAGAASPNFSRSPRYNPGWADTGSSAACRGARRIAKGTPPTRAPPLMPAGAAQHGRNDDPPCPAGHGGAATWRPGRATRAARWRTAGSNRPAR